MKKTEKTKQYVVFGAGRFGRSVALTMQKSGCDVILVDKDPELIQDLADEVGYAVCGNVEDPDFFKTLGMENVDGAIIALTSSLEASIITTMMCHEMGVKKIIAKAVNHMHEKILYRVGATEVVFPEFDMGRRLGKHLAAENFTDWIELSSEFSLVEMNVPNAWKERTLAQLRIREVYHVNVIGLKEGDEVRVQIDPNEALKRDAILIVAGKNSDLEALKD